MNSAPITDDDFHAYVDGQLSAARRLAVDAYLETHPEAAERIRAYQAQNEALKMLFTPVLDEPLPTSLVRQTQAPVRSAWWRAREMLPRLAAGILIAMLGGVGGWFAHQQMNPPALLAKGVSLPHQAAIAHAVFSPDVRRPVEVTAENEDQLVTWLSKRLGKPVRPPHLGALGFELIGGRLLPGNQGPVAQFMYHDGSGQRLTLFVSTEVAGNRETAFRFSREGTLNVFYWVDGNFGYALSGGIPKDQLGAIASAVYDQLEKR